MMRLRSFSLVLVALGAAAPLSAQRPDVRRAPRLTAPDSAEMQMRRLLRVVDSLKRLYDDDDLPTADQRRVGDELDRTVAQFRDLSDRVERWNERSDAQRESFLSLRVGPLARAGTDAANALTRSIAQDATPRGWIGIVLSGALMESRIERGELILRYLSYPLIASVDPSSPAQRAGLAANDTLVAYNGHDVREAYISMTRLLQPNARLNIRVRRDGRTRDLPVVVAEAPSRIRQRRNDEIRELQAPWAVAGVPNAPSFPRLQPPSPVSAGVPRVPRSPAGVLAPPTPFAPPPAMLPMPPAFGFVVNAVAGAQLVNVTEGLARTLGVPSGVLVASVASGSPAGESGLRDGDVIVRVSGQPVRSVAQVRDLVARAADGGERQVELDCVRERRAMRLTLRF